MLTKNRERLQEGDVFEKFMTKLLKHEKVKPLLSDEHFSVDGTLIEAWASHKSFKPKQAKTDDDGSNFHGQLRKNDTHQSMTDPEAKLYRKADGREAKLSYLGHALMENRNGLAVGGIIPLASAPRATSCSGLAAHISATRLMAAAISDARAPAVRRSTALIAITRFSDGLSPVWRPTRPILRSRLQLWTRS